MSNVIELNPAQNHWQRRLSAYNIPEHTQGALLRYLENRFQPGGFLTAVLSNDLVGAVARADSINIKHLKEIVQFVYSEMPSESWGSESRVAAWLAQRA